MTDINNNDLVSGRSQTVSGDPFHYLHFVIDQDKIYYTTEFIGKSYTVIGSVLYRGLSYPILSVEEDYKKFFSQLILQYGFSINNRLTVVIDNNLCQFKDQSIIDLIAVETMVYANGVDWTDVVFKAVKEVGDDLIVQLPLQYDDDLRYYSSDDLINLTNDLISASDVTPIYTELSCFYIPKVGFLNHPLGHAGIISEVRRKTYQDFYATDLESLKMLIGRLFGAIIFSSIKRRKVVEFRYIYRMSDERTFFKDLLNANYSIELYTRDGSLTIKSTTDLNLLNQVRFYQNGKKRAYYFSRFS